MSTAIQISEKGKIIGIEISDKIILSLSSKIQTDKIILLRSKIPTRIDTEIIIDFYREKYTFKFFGERIWSSVFPFEEKEPLFNFKIKGCGKEFIDAIFRIQNLFSSIEKEFRFSYFRCFCIKVFEFCKENLRSRMRYTSNQIVIKKDGVEYIIDALNKKVFRNGNAIINSFIKDEDEMERNFLFFKRTILDDFSEELFVKE